MIARHGALDRFFSSCRPSKPQYAFVPRVIGDLDPFIHRPAQCIPARTHTILKKYKYTQAHATFIFF
jgi:hypothetical protein